MENKDDSTTATIPSVQPAGTGASKYYNEQYTYQKLRSLKWFSSQQKEQSINMTGNQINQSGEGSILPSNNGFYGFQQNN